MSDGQGDASVTDRQAADQALREAFQALADSSHDELPPDDLDRIWRAVSGELSVEERRALVDRMATDPGVAEAWRVAQELWSASSLQTPAVSPAARFWTRPWLAAAAVLVMGVAIGLVFQRFPGPNDDTFRNPDRYAVETLVPSDAALPRNAFRLAWKPGPADARYQVRVTTEDLRVLATIADLTTPEIVVDPSVLAGVSAGARVLWQVEATLPGGETVSSRTFIVRVQ
jgi:hypothetical protein